MQLMSYFKIKEIYFRIGGEKSVFLINIEIHEFWIQTNTTELFKCLSQETKI